jgi:hypothetical protein
MKHFRMDMKKMTEINTDYKMDCFLQDLETV